MEAKFNNRLLNNQRMSCPAFAMGIVRNLIKLDVSDCCTAFNECGVEMK